MGVSAAFVMEQDALFEKTHAAEKKCETCRRCGSLMEYGLDLEPYGISTNFCLVGHDEFMSNEYCPYRLE